MKRYKTGLVLSGGGSRGFAHLGVIKALEEKGIRPDVISGTSAGSVVGSLIADGLQPEEIFEGQASRKFFSYTKFNYFKKGVFNFNALQQTLDEIYSVKNIEDLKIPFYACVTNLNAGKAEYINHGKLTDIVIASASIPGLFKPVEINGITYIDGGVIDNIPIKPLIGKCDTIICVNLIHLNYQESFYDYKHVIKRTHDVLTYHNQQTPLTACDILIEPPEIADLPFLSNKDARKTFDVGYNYVMNSDLFE